jgi:Lar family restriction alleviation protein
MNDFLPCPFCGKRDYEHEIEGNYGDFRVSCGYCGAKGERGDDIDEAVGNWNTRARQTDSVEYLSGFIDAKQKILDAINFIGNKKDSEHE